MTVPNAVERRLRQRGSRPESYPRGGANVIPGARFRSRTAHGGQFSVGSRRNDDRGAWGRAGKRSYIRQSSSVDAKMSLPN